MFLNKQTIKNKIKSLYKMTLKPIIIMYNIYTGLIYQRIIKNQSHKR
jgi:hypothetical protein